MSPVWHQQPGEPALWHGRFQTFLQLGARRTVYAAYVETCREQDKTPSGSAPGAWNRNAKTHNWQSRAAAFDADQLKRASEALDDTMTRLRLAAPDAAKALVKLLASDSEEQARLAANSILNRIGAVHTPQPDDDGRLPISIIEVVTKQEQEHGS